MNFEEFFKDLENKLSKENINIDKEQAKKLYNYMNLLIEWNNNINLTAITEPKEIIIKHFVDSLTILKYINDEDKIIDVGTGAGFPGIPLNIVKGNAKYTLVDSLNKRIKFLEEVINTENLSNINVVHGRAEDVGSNKIYREKYNIATSRAVAQLNVLLEYLLPLVKVGGICICMKGSNIDEEILQAENALKLLGGRIEKIEKIILPETDMVRNLIIIKKINPTPIKYPRKAGTPAKEPL